MKRYYRIMAGSSSVFAAECFEGGFIGVDFGFTQDLSQDLPDNWQAFNKKFIPIWLAKHPEKTKVAAGLACGMTWTVCKGLHQGDIVICPAGDGTYRAGEVTGGYEYHPGTNLPHRRPVKWLDILIDKKEMSDGLRRSAGAIGTVADISRHAEEIEKLISPRAEPVLISRDENIEDPYTFAMEKHLEDFLVNNWAHTSFGKKYDIYEENGVMAGQQYLTDTGPIDILAISKDKKTLLVIELKKGRPSDVVVGQILRYMGYVKDELAEEGQEVRGAIIALEEDLRLRQALRMTPFIEFFRYEISFRLVKV